MEKLWEEKQMDGYRLIRNEEGKDLGVSDGSKDIDGGRTCVQGFSGNRRAGAL